MFGHFTYLATIFIFSGTVVIIDWLLAYKHLKKYLKQILLVGIIATLITSPFEGTAFALRGWYYYPETTFHTLFLGAEIETYFFSFMSAVAVASTVAWLISSEKKRR